MKNQTILYAYNLIIKSYMTSKKMEAISMNRLKITHRKLYDMADV
jgi:hypothetical protein